MLTQALSLAAALLAAAGLSALGLVGGSWLEGRGALKQTLVAAASLVPLLIAMRVSHASLGSVGLTRTNLARSAVIGGALAAGWLVAFGTLDELFSPRLEHAFVLVAAVSVGFSEEIVSRGYVQTRLIRWIGTPRGIVVAATIFALFHIPQRLMAGTGGTDLALQLLVVAALGAAFGVMQAATTNVTLPGIVHTAIDWSARFSAVGR